LTRRLLQAIAGRSTVVDLASRFAFRCEIACWRPNIVLSWMNRVALLCPRGAFVMSVG
jgi:hypothetical protein